MTDKTTHVYRYICLVIILFLHNNKKHLPQIKVVWGLLKIFFSAVSQQPKRMVWFHFVMIAITILIGSDCFANIKLTKLCYQLLVTCHRCARPEVRRAKTSEQAFAARNAVGRAVTSLVFPGGTAKKLRAAAEMAEWNLKP